MRLFGIFFKNIDVWSLFLEILIELVWNGDYNFIIFFLRFEDYYV